MSFFGWMGSVHVLSVAVGLLAGWLLGGLGNLAADRLPAWPGEAWRPPVRHDLRHAWSLLWFGRQGGRCPGCGQTISRRHPWLEVAAAGAGGLAGWRFAGEWTLLAVVLLYTGYLLAVLVIDLETRRVLNVMTVPAALIALALSLLPATPAPLSALLGGGLGLGVFLILALVGRGGLGLGDVKLAGVIGLMVGYPDVIPALAAGVILGGVAALYLLVVRRVGRRATLAYAPYLSLGAIYALFFFFGG